MFDVATAISGPRPPRSERRDTGSACTAGSSLLTRVTVSIDTAANTANDTRHPAAVPNDVSSGTPRTRPADAPLPASASARPTCARDTILVNYPTTTEKNSACFTPPTVRPTATTANAGAAATSALLTA